MSNLILPVLLVTIESIVYLLLEMWMNIPLETSIRTLFLYLVLMFVYGHFSVRSTLIWDGMKNSMKALFIYFVAACVFADMNTWYIDVIMYAFMSIVMLAFSTWLSRSIRVHFRDVLARRTLIIGRGSEAVRYLEVTKNNRFALTKVVGMVTLDGTAKFGGKLFETQAMTKEHFGNGLKTYAYDEIDGIILRKRINQIVVILPEAKRDVLDKVTMDVNGKVPHIKFFVEGSGLITFSTVVQDFDGLLLISTSKNTISLVERMVKRLVDILAGITGCLLLLPIGIYIKYKYVKNGDKDSIIFTQDRIGVNGKAIKIYKFRTMVPNAEALLEKLMNEDAAIKTEYLLNKKLRNDPRITPLGHKLRNSSLDEFPQFINVLKGEMSLIGPRPYLFREQEDMGIYYDSIVLCKPGITGMWQANGRSDVGFVDRCKLDDYYYHNWAISLDFVIFYKTVKGVFYGKGAL